MDKLQGEIELIKTSAAPILGICYGCELIAVAYGGTLKDTGAKKTGVLEIQPTGNDPLFAGLGPLMVYDAHRWVIETVPEELEVLATSSDGPEILRHKTRPILGFQFHPEKMTEETVGDELYRAFIKSL